MKFSESLSIAELSDALNMIEALGPDGKLSIGNTSIFREAIVNHIGELFDAIDGLNNLTRTEVVELGLGINAEREKEINDLKEQIKEMHDLNSRLKKIELIMKKQ